VEQAPILRNPRATADPAGIFVGIHISTSPLRKTLWQQPSRVKPKSPWPQLSGMARAAKIGKILGLDAIIVGSITQFGNETKNRKICGAGGGLGGLGIGGFGQKKSKAIVAIDARMVDVDTGEFLAVADGKGESKRESTSLLGGGGN
jgi:curli production assembly/transport component CsgG